MCDASRPEAADECHGVVDLAIQPATSSTARWAVGTLFVLGTVLYAFAGAHLASTLDET